MTVDISARKVEMTAVVDWLAQEGIETSQEGARALIKAAMNMVLNRDWYVATTDTRSTYGLYATRDAAVKAAKNNEFGEPAGVAIVRVLSAQKRADYVRSQA